MSSCTILILTYKGKHHLHSLLPTVHDAIENYQGNSAINVMIIDNGSDEITRDFVKVFYPNFCYQFSHVNDFLFSLNKVVKDLTSDYILLLNDDIRLDKELLNELLPIMENGDDSLFGISCRNLDWEGIYTTSGVRMASYKNGWMKNYWLDTKETETKYTLFASGGSSILRTKYFNVLGGFDTLYRPAYSEDMDLGIRAWQNGWKVLYHPKAYVYHREGGSTKDYFKLNKLEIIIFKNQVSCMIKNTRRPGFLFWFFFFLPYRLLYNYLNHKNYYKGLMKALGQLSLALSQRQKTKIMVKDKDWISFLNMRYYHSNI